MKNPFLRPATIGEWLVSSLCWVGSCTAGTWLLSKAVGELWRALEIHGSVVPALVFLGSSYAAILLIWRRVLVGSSAVLAQGPPDGSFSWAGLAMLGWRLLLGLLLVSMLAGLLLCSLALLGDVFDHEPLGDYF